MHRIPWKLVISGNPRIGTSVMLTPLTYSSLGSLGLFEVDTPSNLVT